MSKRQATAQLIIAEGVALFAHAILIRPRLLRWARPTRSGSSPVTMRCRERRSKGTRSDHDRSPPEALIAYVWNRGDYDRLPQLVDESYVGHPSGVVGTAAYRRYYEDLRQASSDIAFSIEDQLAEGDRVVTRWTARGTHTGPFAGLSSTGRTYQFTGTSTHSIAGDRVVECWTDMDEMGLLRQLGAVPAPASA